MVSGILVVSLIDGNSNFHRAPFEQELNFPHGRLIMVEVIRTTNQTEDAIHKVTKEIHFCYGHRLLNYSGKCQHLHGHNAIAEIEIASQSLDPRGMVVDFGDINQVVKTWIDQNLDHTMLLCERDPVLKILQDLEEPCFVMEENPTAENIARVIYEYAESQGLPVAEVRLWETPTSYATYRK